MTVNPSLQPMLDALDSRLKTGKLKLEIKSETELELVPQVPDSFPLTVTLHAEDDVEVGFAPWSEHLGSVGKATNLLTWLLTPYYRVVTTYSKGQAIESYTEAYRNGGWEFRVEVYFMDPEQDLPDPDEIRIRQQAVFLDSNYLTHYPQAQLDRAGYPVGTLLGETIYESRNGEWHPTNVPDLPQD
jgi:hypothetical protein